MADFMEIKRNRPDWSQILAQAGPGLQQGMGAQSAIQAQLLPLLFKAQLESQAKRAELDYTTQKEQDRFERNISFLKNLDPGGHLKYSIGSDGKMDVSLKPASEIKQERENVEAQGLSAVMPRFGKYALHEAGGTEPGTATQRLGQLQSKLISGYPTQTSVIEKFMGGLTPPKTGGKAALNPQNFAKGMGQMFKNTEEAMPETSEFKPWQRFHGMNVRLGAKLGFTSAKQTAEIATMKVRARSYLKNFENNRFTDKDIEQAIEGMTDVGKTTAERLATVLNVTTAAAAANGISEGPIKEQLAKEIGMTVPEMEAIVNETPATGKKDNFGHFVGEKKYSPKYKRQLTYTGNDQWE